MAHELVLWCWCSGNLLINNGFPFVRPSKNRRHVFRFFFIIKCIYLFFLLNLYLLSDYIYGFMVWSVCVPWNNARCQRRWRRIFALISIRLPAQRQLIHYSCAFGNKADEPRTVGVGVLYKNGNKIALNDCKVRRVRVCFVIFIFVHHSHFCICVVESVVHGLRLACARPPTVAYRHSSLRP